MVYALTMLAAVLTGALLSRFYQRDVGLAPSERWGIAIGAFCGAMLGAKLPFVLSDWQGLLSGWAWFANGKTIMCGLVGGYAGVEVAKWSLGIRVKTGDSFAVPVAAAIAVGRLACFVGGCCFGLPTTRAWGVVFPQIDSQPRHPTQLYEAAFHALAALALAWLHHRGLFRGQLVKLYILSYLVFRFVTETLRPEARMAAGLTAYQWAAIPLALLFAGLWVYDARRSVGCVKHTSGAL